MGTAVPLILLTVLTAGAMLFTPPRARAWSTLLALMLAPALLAASVWDVAAFASLRDRPLLLTGLVAGAGIVVLVGARVFHRRPELIALAAAAALPFRVPISVDGSVSNLLLPLYAVVAAAALSYALPRIFGDEPVDVRERRPHLLEWLLAATLVLYAAQAIGSLDKDTAVEHVVFFYVPFALLFAQLARLEWTLDLAGRVLAVLVVLALAFAAVGFVEYATRHLLLNPKVIASNQVESYFRVNSLFFDPNIYGRFLAIVMLGVATVLLWATRRRTLIASGLITAVLWAGLVLTLSQSSFAALLVGLAVLGGLRWSVRLAAFGVAAALVCGVVLVLAVPGHLGVSLSSKDGANASTSGRYDLISGGVRLAADRPLRGYGSGGFSRAYRRAEKGSAERAVSASHNAPVTVAAEQGVAGLLLYLALVITAMITLLRGASGSPLRAAVGASFVAIFVHSLSYSAFLEDPLTWVLLASGLVAALADRVGDGDDAAARSEILAVCGLFVAGVVLWALIPTVPNYDAYYHLVWGRELLDGGAPSFGAYAAPTPHPLYLGLCTLLALLGESADRLLVLVTVLSHVAFTWAVYRLGTAVWDRRAGVVGALLAGSSFALLLYAARAYVDVPYLALVLWAAALEAEQPRRGRSVLVLLALAGLLRPEAWLLTGVYWLWLKRPWRLLPWVVAGPLIWMLVDLLVTGDPFWSLHATSNLAKDLGRNTGLVSALKDGVVFVAGTAREPVAAAAIVGLVVARRRREGQAAHVLIGLTLAGTAAFLLTSAAGLSVLPRYLTVPAVVLCLLAGYLVTRTRWLTGLAVVAGLLFLAVRSDVVGRLTEELRFIRTTHDDLQALVLDPRISAARQCGAVTLPNYRLVPDTLWILDASAPEVGARSNNEYVYDSGVALIYTSKKLLKRYGYAAGTPRRTNLPPRGFRPIASSGGFRAFGSC